MVVIMRCVLSDQAAAAWLFVQNDDFTLPVCIDTAEYCGDPAERRNPSFIYLRRKQQ